MLSSPLAAGFLKVAAVAVSLGGLTAGAVFAYQTTQAETALGSFTPFTEGPAAGLVQEGSCGDPREPGELAILGHTQPAADHGTVRIPELNVTANIASGCFEFRNLTLPRDPVLVSFVVEVDGYRPTTWANWLLLTAGVAPVFTPQLEVGDVPQTFDLCPEILATPREDRSAAQSGYVGPCLALLPFTGYGTDVATANWLSVALLALMGVGTALLVLGSHVREQANG